MAVAQDKRASELTAPVSIEDTDTFPGYRPGTGGEPNLDIRASAGLIRAPIIAALAAGDVTVAAGGVVTAAGAFGTGSVAAALATILNEMAFAVTRFGADRTGAVSSAAAITAAIAAVAAAAGGGDVFLPRGVYAIDADISVTAGVSLWGDHAVIKRTAYGKEFILFGNQTVRGIAFDGGIDSLGADPNNPTYYCELRVNGPNVNIDKCRLYNLTGSGIGNTIRTDQDVYNLNITNSSIRDYRDHGIYLGLSSPNSVIPAPRNIRITNCEVIQDPAFVYGGGGNEAIKFREAGEDVSISGCHIEGVTALYVGMSVESQNNGRLIKKISFIGNNGSTSGALFRCENTTTGVRDARMPGLHVANNVFTNTSTNGYSAYVNTGSRAALIDALFANNTLTNYGGAVLNGDANFMSENITIDGDTITIPSTAAPSSTLFYTKFVTNYTIKNLKIISTAAAQASVFFLYTDDDSHVTLMNNEVTFPSTNMVSLANKARVRLTISGGYYTGCTSYFFANPLLTGFSSVAVHGANFLLDLGAPSSLYNKFTSNIDHSIFAFGRHSINGMTMERSTNGVPVNGTWTRGQVLMEDFPSTAGTGMRMCTVSGTLNTALSGITATTTSGSPTVTFNDASGLKREQFVTIAGVTGLQIKNISGNTVTMYANASASVTDAAVSWTAAIFKNLTLS
jgi:hypothetical protein